MFMFNYINETAIRGKQILKDLDWTDSWWREVLLDANAMRRWNP